MIELSNERINQILHEETVKTEDVKTILRAVYTRYMRLYENYLSNFDALTDETIEQFKQYHEETKSLLKYYYMDIPQDVCDEIKEFEEKYSTNLLGPQWHEYVSGSFNQFKKASGNGIKSEEDWKAEFTKQTLKAFYDTMDDIFRDGFDTGSKTAENAANTLAGWLFGSK